MKNTLISRIAQNIIYPYFYSKYKPEQVDNNSN